MYSDSMPWVSLLYEDERTEEHRKFFDVEGIMYYLADHEL